MCCPAMVLSKLLLPGLLSRTLPSIRHLKPVLRTPPLTSVVHHPTLHIPKSWVHATLYRKENEIRNKIYRNYFLALILFMGGMSYAFVPLYNIFCRRTGLGVQVTKDDDRNRVLKLKKVEDRKILISFNADKDSALAWNFKPIQPKLVVCPGETALAFYTVENQTDEPVKGIATYNILPYEVGPYFNKIQCFCFEEQLLFPGEKVDLPVYFYIDTEFDDDPNLNYVKEVVLSYSFFKSTPSTQLPLPNFMRPKE